jgi:phage baseplate assembly protein gpV
MAKLTDVMGRPHSGLIPWAVVGLVTDNVDPDELGRIQVKFPTLHEEPLSFWIRQISPNAGKERGLYALPEIDDEVMVLFMQGSHDVGVIIGQFWNGVDIPPQECKDTMPKPGDTAKQERSTDEFNDGTKNLEKNDRRFWKSRSGHLIVLDDSNGAETVQIWDQTHTLSLVFDSADSRILLTNSKGDIHIRTKTDLYLEAGNDIIVTAKNNIDTLAHNDILFECDMNWSMKAGMDATEEAGMNFSIDAGMDLTGKAGLNAKFEGSVNFEAKGGVQAKLEGSAMAVVKGGIVMIN